MKPIFLDRDGVINVRIPGDYVKRPDEFVLAPGAGEALRLLSARFSPVIVVTNQAGIGKGLMTETDLHAVHARMIELVESAGGRIDAVFFCPHRSDAGCHCRKPATGMAEQATERFGNLPFAETWMVGDSASDIHFGQNSGMKTALIAGKTEETATLQTLLPDARFDTLLDFARQFML